MGGYQKIIFSHTLEWGVPVGAIPSYNTDSAPDIDSHGRKIDTQLLANISTIQETEQTKPKPRTHTHTQTHTHTVIKGKHTDNQQSKPKREKLFNLKGDMPKPIQISKKLDKRQKQIHETQLKQKTQQTDQIHGQCK